MATETNGMTVLDALKVYKYQLSLCLLLLAGIYYSILPQMVRVWYADSNYSHGFIVPFIAGYFLYVRWDALAHTRIAPWGPGIFLLAAGVAELLAGWLGTEYFTMRSSLIVVLGGMVLYFFGKEAFRKTFLPIAYLIFMVPVPYIVYDAVALPLKLLVSRVSVAVLKGIGVSVIREGNIIIFPVITLEVADACSGLRSIVSLSAMAVAYAFFTRTSSAKRWVIVASAVPIAIVTNALRVIVTGILAQHWGEKAAGGFFHEFAGLLVFGLALAMLVGVGTALRGKDGA